MKLKSFGCSFVYGSDLPDCPHGTGKNNPHGTGKNNPPPSSLSWPALLSRDFELEYQCLARPGASNLQILEAVLSEIEPQSVFVINWTWNERFGYFNDELKIKNNGHPWNPHGWVTVMPSDNDAAAEAYYRYLHSQMRDKLDALVCIKSAIDNLKENDIKFFMTYTDDLLWETQWHTTPAIRYLQEKIRPYVHGFQGQGFISWARSRGFQLSEKMHPSETAHKAAADIFRSKLHDVIHTGSRETQ